MILNCCKNIIKKYNIKINKKIKYSKIQHDIFENLYAKYFTIGKANFIVFFDSITTFTIFYITEEKHNMKLKDIYAYTLAITLECYRYKKDLIYFILSKLKKCNYDAAYNKNINVLINNKIKQFKKIFLKEIKISGNANLEKITDAINSESNSDTHPISPKLIFLNQLTKMNNILH